MPPPNGFPTNGSNGNGNGASNGNGNASPGGMPAVHIPKPIEQTVQQDIIRDRHPVIPHIATYSGLYNAANKNYYVYWDEALRSSQANTLAMRRDGFVHEILRHRQIPIISLPPYIEVDDPDDVGQTSISETLLKIYKNIPRLKSNILLPLSEAMFYGRYGVQIQIGPRKVAGNEWNSIVRGIPVNGDKFRYKWDGTPGIAIYSGVGNNQLLDQSKFLDRYSEYIETSMLGKALFLKNKFLRDRFVIHNFEPSDTDYLFEIDESQSIFGLGLRSRLYWCWNLRLELLSWIVDALQRVGANGMIYAAYNSGNYQMQQDVLLSLRQLVKDNISAFPKSPNDSVKDMLQRIEPSAVGYEVMMSLIQHLEGFMRRATLGQDLSSESKATGIGGGATALHMDVRRDYMECDAEALSETVNEDLISVLLRYNKWKYKGKVYGGDDLPFSMRLKYQIEQKDPSERMQAATALFQMGVELDKDDVREAAGFTPPKKDETALINPQLQAQSQQVQAGVPATNQLHDSLKGLVGAGKQAQGLGMLRGGNGGNEQRQNPSEFSQSRMNRLSLAGDPDYMLSRLSVNEDEKKKRFSSALTAFYEHRGLVK